MKEEKRRKEGTSTASAASWLSIPLVAKQPDSNTVWYRMQGFI